MPSAKNKNENLIGYVISKDYNKREMFARDDDSIPRCPVCTYRLEHLKTNVDFNLMKRSRTSDYIEIVRKESALTSTYDLKCIANVMFKEFCLEQKYEKLIFEAFSSDPWHFHFLVNNEIPIDRERSNTRFLDKCTLCGRYESVVGEFTFYGINKPLDDGFYCSDLLLGSRDSKGQRIIVAAETRDKIIAANLHGIVFHEAFGL